jgi:hypothetical protein
MSDIDVSFGRRDIMKRLSVSILLFILACPAQAGLHIWVNGEPPDSEIYILPSDTLNLGIFADPGEHAVWTLILAVDGSGQIYGGHVWCPPGYICLEDPEPPDWPFDDWLYMDLFLIYPNPQPLEGLVVTDIIFHCEGPGDVTLTLLDGADGSTWETVTIHQHPDPPPPKLPDLFTHTVSDRFTPAQLSPSEMLSIRWLGSNNGTVCIPEDPWCFEQFGPAQGPWVEAVFLSKDSHPDSGDILLGTVTFTGTLAPSGSHEVQTQFQIPADCPFGDYKVIVYIDYVPTEPAGCIQETNETNNWALCQGTLSVVPRFATFYVDDDAPGDPGPNDPSVSDPCENGTAEHPFDAIQEAIDAAIDRDTIIVLPGTYAEDINFLGKNITLTSSKPTESSTVKSTTIDGFVRFRGTEDPNCTLTGFNINQSIIGCDWEIDPTGDNHTHATISHCILDDIMTGCGGVIQACDGIISNCIIANTIYGCARPWPVPAIVGCHGLIKNCTMVNMYDGIEIGPGGTCTMENCILYDSSPILVPTGATLNISYCDIYSPSGIAWIIGTVNWGPGNNGRDPCFVCVGTWGDNGDYHLKSQAGRWDADEERWTIDEVTSPCIDAGNPMSPIGSEPFPNGGIINMGAYGGTAEASKSYFGKPPCETIIAGDVNGDCAVDFRDFWFIALHWMQDNSP